MKLDPTHYVLIGVLALTFLPKFLGTWESRSYDNTQALENKVSTLETKVVSLETRFNGFENTLQKVLTNVEQFNRTSFDTETLTAKFTTFVQEVKAENLRQWQRINENEEAYDRLDARLDRTE